MSTQTLPEAWKPFAKEPDTAPVVTGEQLELVKRTVANGATADELKLYLYDCQRQGVHPLDKLIHFTKRSGKYTPITSIDFMRTRAADTGEYAGSDDALFTGAIGDAFAASVTVWRLVGGQRCPFTATARWSEYKPEQNDFMWKRMPHTMLAKCAEALALRKGFPRQLAGLYAKEEMDQADGPKGYVVEPINSVPPPGPAGALPQIIETRGTQEPPAHQPLPEGAVLITKVESGRGQAKGFLHHSGQTISLHGNDGIALYDERIVALASEVCQTREPVTLEFKTAASGKSYVKAIHRVVTQKEPDDAIPYADDPPF